MCSVDSRDTDIRMVVRDVAARAEAGLLIGPSSRLRGFVDGHRIPFLGLYLVSFDNVE